jgi:hypothetical protein
MAKEINEKTFELNITNQLLDISKSFVWYMMDSPICDLIDENEWFDFLTNNTFFAEGLTQAQETNPLTGGYDVSINYSGINGNTGRLLFLQYKSGERAGFCKKKVSQFYGNRTNKKEHIIFKFNDAANCTQHSTLRNLAKRVGIQPDSVLYVFPRVTERAEFINNYNNLLSLTSFVPILELDKQGLAQTPPVNIIDGISHNYRTSYDGNTSEVNYYYFYFFYEQKIISDLLAELICVQLERFFKFLQNKEVGQIILSELIIKGLENGFLYNQIKFKDLNINKEIIVDYLSKMQNANFKIPKAPQKYTIEIPVAGIELSFDEKIDLSNITYQII